MKIFKKIFFLLNGLYGRYRRKMLLMTGIGFISGFFEGVGITLLIPLFTFFVGQNNATLGSSFTAKFVEKAFGYFSLKPSFTSVLLIVLVFFAAKTILVFYFSYIRTKIMADYKAGTRSDLYRDFLRADFAYLRKQKAGYFENVAMTSIKQSSKLLEYLINLVLTASTTVVYAAVAMALSPVIVSITLGICLILFLAYRPLIRRLRNYSRDLISIGKKISHHFHETLFGIKTIKTFGAVDQVIEKTNPLFRSVEKLEFDKNIVKQIIKLSLEPDGVLVIMGVFAVSYLYLQFDMVVFISIVYLINQIFGNLAKVQSALHIVSETVPSANDLLLITNEIRSHAQTSSGAKPFIFDKSMRLDSIDCVYKDDKKILDNISLEIKPGEFIGIIGRSGAGKTTIVDLILRLYEPQSGSILLDDVPVKEISLAEWRRYVVNVTQEVFLQNATISENIRFYDNDISEADIVEACCLVGINELFESLPDKYETIVGERGNRFSGGEKQRIALARALARKPKILVLDEATSALDNISEEQIKKVIEKLKGKVTVIVIAHRLSSVSSADRLLVVKDGRLIESGSPKNLLANPDSYYAKSLGYESFDRDRNPDDN